MKGSVGQFGIRRAIVLAGLVLCLGVAWSATVWAQQAQSEDPNVVAGDLSTQATDRYNAGDVEGALELFLQAFDLLSDPNFAFNIALLYEELGSLPLAYQYYQMYVSLYPGAPDRAEVDGILAEFEATLNSEYARVVLDSQPQGATIRITAGGRTDVYGVTPLETYVAPGSVTITAQLEDHSDATLQRNAVAGINLVIEGRQLVLTPLVGDDPDEPSGGGGGVSTIVGWSSIGLGVLASGLATIFWIDADDKAGEHEDERARIGSATNPPQLSLDDFNQLESDADDAAFLGNLLFGVGVTAIVAGVAVLIFAGSGDEAGSSDTAFMPPSVYVLHDGAGVGWGMSF